MSDRQPRQVQCKLGDADADGNWQLDSPRSASATDDKTQTQEHGRIRRGHRVFVRRPPLFEDELEDEMLLNQLK